MSYISFTKEQLVNLEFSLNREIIRSNRAGSYASTTIINCNTRKYHGLLVVPQPFIDGENHILLSSLDETVIQQDAEFNLGIHKFPNDVYLPKGHKYLRSFVTEPIPILTYRVGGVLLEKEMLLTGNDDRMIIKYTLVEAHSKTKLKLKPFLAFRNIHKLSKANHFADKTYEVVNNGIKMQLYQGYSHLFMQCSKKAEYIHVPDWYYNIEYQQEKERGYDYQEDLLVPGYFEFELAKGESVYFTAGIEEVNAANLKKIYNNEISKRIPRDNFENCLKNSAQQFIVKRNKKTEVIAGFPWFGRWGRDTFISLPGLTLVNGDYKSCKDVLDTMVSELKGPLFPNIGVGSNSAYNSVDAPLWFFWALQQYAEFTDSKDKIWKEYGKKMRSILEGYKNGTMHNIKMLDNGLIYAGEPGKALTWMDAVVNGKPVTPRIGLPVEISALWYNAMMFSIEVAKIAGDDKFVNEWEALSEKIKVSFKETFWSKDMGYLADFVCDDYYDWSIRPNMVIATSLPYSPLSEKIRQLILELIRKELLTPRGLRTLSPKNPDYKEIYFGNQTERDSAYHQGTVWPWLLGHFVEAYLKIYGKSGLSFIKNIYEGFEPVITEHGITSISEVYDGNPPHLPGGTPSQAWSVAELLRIKWLIDKYENN
ncbi:MAG: glycogen debranching enzyme N-terminal domain-containing protein [Bacteroidetes bacterium]|nr:glycogen debranching enzyme N-terminal domain-containing protein [Bacteroidota bacterium]